jgi:hypothetical protein
MDPLYSRSFNTQLNDEMTIYEYLELGSMAVQAVLRSCDYKQGSHVTSKSILISVCLSRLFVLYRVPSSPSHAASALRFRLSSGVVCVWSANLTDPEDITPDPLP